jgi:hypothetical protein
MNLKDLLNPKVETPEQALGRLKKAAEDAKAREAAAMVIYEKKKQADAYRKEIMDSNLKTKNLLQGAGTTPRSRIMGYAIVGICILLLLIIATKC